MKEGRNARLHHEFQHPLESNKSRGSFLSQTCIFLRRIRQHFLDESLRGKLLQPAIPIPSHQYPINTNPPLFRAPSPPSMDPRRLASIIAILLLVPTIASGEDCRPSSCGNLRNISSPFRLATDPSTCGDPQYQLTCDQNRAVLELYSTKYFVEEISYEDQAARVFLDPASCSPRTLPFLPPSKFKYGDPFALNTSNGSVTFVTCPASSMGDPSYIRIDSCVDNSSSSKGYLYALAGDATVAALRKSCATAGTVPVAGMLRNRTQAAVRDVLLRGFYISWKVPMLCRDCVADELQCSYYRGGHLSPSSSSSSLLGILHDKSVMLYRSHRLLFLPGAKVARALLQWMRK